MYDLIEEYKMYGIDVKFKVARPYTEAGEIHPPYEIELHNPSDKPKSVSLAIYLGSLPQIPFPFGPLIEMQPQETKIIPGQQLLFPEKLPVKDRFVFRVKKIRGSLFKILMSPTYLLYIVMYIYVILAGCLRGGSAQARDGLNFIVALLTGGRKRKIGFTRQ